MNSNNTTANTTINKKIRSIFSPHINGRYQNDDNNNKLVTDNNFEYQQKQYGLKIKSSTYVAA